MYPITEELLHFGLTRQEANLYLTLLSHGEISGYEAAKLTGISRSNTYTALAGLVDKGAAYIMEETAVRYMAVPFAEFSDNIIRRLRMKQESLLPRLPQKQEQTQGYITIRGEQQIMDKLITLILETRQRLYISVPGDILSVLLPYLKQQTEEEKRVVILTDIPCPLNGAVVYRTQKKEAQIRLIVDSIKVLTGSILAGENATCLFSKNKNLVDVFKEMLKNEITLIEMGKSV
jgi:HTH-type transcriptional regulator, sugar sensing transcriptional regulator